MSTSSSCRDSIKLFGAPAASGLGGVACLSISSPRSEGPVAAKWSAGTGLPQTWLPANTTDGHHPIYDVRLTRAPQATLKPDGVTVEDHRVLQRRLGKPGNVFVQPSCYGDDNRLLVESLGTFHGLAARVAAPGWHIQVNAPANYLLERKSTWAQLPCAVVFDHLARVPQPASVNHEVFGVVQDLLQKDGACVKLSGVYFDTEAGPPTSIGRVIVTQTVAKEAPERMPWGGDWPHPTDKPSHKMPNDALLADLFAKAAPNDAIRDRILVINPANFYQFT